MKLVYSDLIVAYGQGRTVQFQDCTLKDPTEWNDLEADNTAVWPSLLRTDGQPSVRFKFRLKPRTVKIGNREIEAPVLEPLADDVVWFVFADGAIGSGLARRQQRVVDAGRAFNSHEAAESFNLALRALMRGEA